MCCDCGCIWRERSDLLYLCPAEPRLAHDWTRACAVIALRCRRSEDPDKVLHSTCTHHALFAHAPSRRRNCNAGFVGQLLAGHRIGVCWTPWKCNRQLGSFWAQHDKATIALPPVVKQIRRTHDWCIEPGCHRERGPSCAWLHVQKVLDVLEVLIIHLLPRRGPALRLRAADHR